MDAVRGKDNGDDKGKAHRRMKTTADELQSENRWMRCDCL